MNDVLQNKHLGDKIRLNHLNIDSFPEIKLGFNPAKKPDFRFSNFGILTRFLNGMVGVTIHYIRKNEDDKKWYGYWIMEATSHTTIDAWAQSHEKHASFFSVQETIEALK